ncbi:MAG TPA: NAD(P)H-dependent oxidoreductase [Spirochaetota bacterium]|nr:NAD(P)H-dependent oxidoreductase [Spirochaetota bacterium]HPI91162.1 NAD(P)H-dependent oxidoreductase [Spirochaetota bacterium]HPR49456.1 NAD(P)H-dependent oxidoreductase [Spirochaetota bacterium]
MRLSIINGSPRATTGNTEKLLGHFIKGFLEKDGNSVEVLHSIKHRPDFIKEKEMFRDAERLLIAFPLYIDAMPGSVKELFESFEPLKGENTGLKLMFMVQCGFPETHHTRFVARYCEKLARRLECEFCGSICKGGCEGLTVQPPALVDKVFSRFHDLGAVYGETGELDPVILGKLAHPEHLTADNLKQVIPMVNAFLWDGWMKKNNVLEKSFDKPYGD